MLYGLFDLDVFPCFRSAILFLGWVYTLTWLLFHHFVRVCFIVICPMILVVWTSFCNWIDDASVCIYNNTNLVGKRLFFCFPTIVLDGD